LSVVGFLVTHLLMTARPQLCYDELIMNVFHIIDSGGLYGAENMLLDLMFEQKKSGVNPILCSIGTPDLDSKEIEKQAKKLDVTVEKIRMRAGPNFLGTKQILKCACHNNSNVLHSHGYKANILLGLVPRKKRSVPLLSTLHGWTSSGMVSKLRLYHAIDVRLLKYKDAVVVVNKLMLKSKQILSANVDKSKLFVVNNGINIKPEIAHDSKSAWFEKIKDFGKNCILIGAVGRLAKEKGFDILLDAISLTRLEGIDVKLVIIGQGPLLSDLKRKVSILNLSNHVMFTGYLSNARRYINIFNIFVISSFSEGLPISLLESMCQEVPILATRVGGIPDIIKDGKTGVLIQSGSADEISDGIKKISNDFELAERITYNAKNLLLDKYTSEKMAAAYFEIYKKLLN
jgi:glycosyltransferase involved in cell wall biosynthesis